MRVMLFLRLNLNDDYNYGMGGADIADQLRGAYRFDKWMRNYKWWHAVFWWGFQVLLVNSYIVYCRYFESKGLKPMSHCKYQEQVGKVWLDPDYFKDKRHNKRERENNQDENSSNKRRCDGSLSSMSTISTGASRRSLFF